MAEKKVIKIHKVSSRSRKAKASPEKLMETLTNAMFPSPGDPIRVLFPDTAVIKFDPKKLEEVVTRALTYNIQNMFPSTFSEKADGVKIMREFIDEIIKSKLYSIQTSEDIHGRIEAAFSKIVGDNLDTFLENAVKARLSEMVEERVRLQADKRKRKPKGD
jgi:hypothetical protein